ncbi:hypothetical protein JCM19240_1219 [Vibrio maritimus]|uniref:Uncharacterized protein n=1 Tax=Vibrio maritimus TaxID=990268 RepID=A0A090T2W4_9VIBR|nr:hypothetical protein JCM19240_1219 [Vibrio maritimus]
MPLYQTRRSTSCHCSKKHALALGYDRAKWRALNTLISQKLFKLLSTEREAFETLGITLEHIFEARES